MVRETRVQSPVESYQRLKKLYLLSTQHYKVKTEVKVEQSGERSNALHYTTVKKLEKWKPSVHSRQWSLNYFALLRIYLKQAHRHGLYIYIYIYMGVCVWVGGHASVGRPIRTYIHLICADTRWSLEDHPAVMIDCRQRDLYIRESLNKFTDIFRMGTFIDSTHMKL